MIYYIIKKIEFDNENVPEYIEIKRFFNSLGFNLSNSMSAI